MSNEKATDLTASITASIATLCAETDAVKQSSTYTAWLKTMSTFHSYSFGNQLLIWSQLPTATRVAGFNKWKSLKRFVTKGQKGIRILAPLVRKAEEVNTTGTTEKVSRIAGFRVVSVFDVSQTEGEEIPSLAVNATEGGETLLPLIENAIAELNITLTYKTLDGAYGLSRGGAIEIEESLDTPGRVGVLVHELAHELLEHKANRATTTKQQRELEAESVAYAVLAHFGMKLPSEFYLATYDINAEMLTAALQTISATTKRIIALVTPATKSQTEEDAETGDSPAQVYPIAA
jgi:N-terminal domain of anti-restriction factor ArdC